MQIQDAVANFSAVNVTLTTTTEKVIITSPLARVHRNSAIVMVWGWAVLTTGTATTAVVCAIRRGTTISDTLVSEINNVAIGAAAGSNEQFQIVCFEQLTSEQVVQYSLTLDQVSATGNGTALQAGICVLII